MERDRDENLDKSIFNRAYERSVEIRGAQGLKGYFNCCEKVPCFCSENASPVERWPEPEMKIINCFALGNRRMICGTPDRPLCPPAEPFQCLKPERLCGFCQDCVDSLQTFPFCFAGDRCCLPGLQVQLQSGTTLSDGFPVPFDTIVNHKSTVVRCAPGSGNLILTQPGNYYVSWSVNLDQVSAGKVRLGLTLDGTPVASTDVWLGRAQVAGTALLTVSSVSAALQLANLTGRDLAYDTATTIRANLVILQLS